MDERTVKANLMVLVMIAIVGIPAFLVWWFLIRKKSFGNVPVKNELVLCHAGYCGYCRDFLPEFHKAVPELQTQFPGLKITMYKHEDDLSSIQKIEPSVTYYPCMRLNVVEFEGPRTAQGVIDFVKANYN
jgi:thiol-disulfide isomerase/thioredoxin